MRRSFAAMIAMSVTFPCVGCSADRMVVQKSVVVDRQRCEVRLSGKVQKTDAPRMSDWGRSSAALLGAREGRNAESFVFLVDAPVVEIRDALTQLGAESRVVLKRSDVAEHKGIRADNTPDDYMQGDPVQIFIEWQDGAGKHCRAYEDFFLEKVEVNGAETTKPWTPHFVYHGGGILNKSSGGCVACTNDCPGGLIGNNTYPVAEPIPLLKADWDRLPAPGTPVTVVLRPVPSGMP